MALKTLTPLFIGGASSASELLSCQSVDGGAADFALLWMAAKSCSS